MSDERGRTDKAAARAEAQRARILDAAQQCFIEDGFHSASMATIAERAVMSPGLIYRYFEGRDAIALAIVEREHSLRRAGIAELHGSVDFTTGLVETFQEMRTGSASVVNAALFLEMSAEATRNEKIAGALQQSDRATRDDFAAFLARSRVEGGRGLAPREAAARALLMHLLFEGLAVRCAREPTLDPEELRGALGLAVDLLG